MYELLPWNSSPTLGWIILLLTIVGHRTGGSVLITIIVKRTYQYGKDDENFIRRWLVGHGVVRVISLNVVLLNIRRFTMNS